MFTYTRKGTPVCITIHLLKAYFFPEEVLLTLLDYSERYMYALRVAGTFPGIPWMRALHNSMQIKPVIICKSPTRHVI